MTFVNETSNSNMIPAEYGNKYKHWLGANRPLTWNHSYYNYSIKYQNNTGTFSFCGFDTNLQPSRRFLVVRIWSANFVMSGVRFASFTGPFPGWQWPLVFGNRPKCGINGPQAPKALYYNNKSSTSCYYLALIQRLLSGKLWSNQNVFSILQMRLCRWDTPINIYSYVRFSSTFATQIM